MKSPPDTASPADKAKQKQAARLAAALRNNLKRRKIARAPVSEPTASEPEQ